MEIDQDKVWFIRGLLTAFASNGQVIHYDELRRLCRMSQEQLGDYLGTARTGLAEGEPDACSVVVTKGGKPGVGWGDLDKWAGALRDAHTYWADRRRLDNGEFEKEHGALPTFPGTLNTK